MGTQDDINGAEPQNEFLSGFKLGAIARNKETQLSDVPKTGKIVGGIGSRKLSTGLQNQAGTNPSQPAQQVSKSIQTEQHNAEPFEKKGEAGTVQKLKTRFMGNTTGAGGIRQKVMVVIIPILFIVMVFMFRQVLTKPPKKTKGDTRSNKKTVLVDKSSSTDINWQIPDPLPATIRDPIKIKETNPEINIQQTSSAQTEDELIQVKSILFSSDKPSVVIGKKIVYLNQKINGATVAEIHRDYIVFEKDGNRWTQTISDEAVRGKKEETVPEYEYPATGIDSNN